MDTNRPMLNRDMSMLVGGFMNPNPVYNSTWFPPNPRI